MEAGLRDQLIGAWKLLSYEERPVDGSPSFYPMNEKPMGIIMYTPDGFMTAQLMKPDRKPFASGDWFKGTDEEYKQKRLPILLTLDLSMWMRSRKHSPIPCSCHCSRTG